MNKEKAFNEVKGLLTKNGIEFTVSKSDDGDAITAKAGKVIQWFTFSDTSIAVISSVIACNYDEIVTSHINMWYEDVREFSFIGGELWLWIKEFGFVVIAFEPNI